MVTRRLRDSMTAVPTCPGDKAEPDLAARRSRFCDTKQQRRRPQKHRRRFGLGLHLLPTISTICLILLSRRIHSVSAQSTPVREVPPEIDVSPEPTPPSSSTTRRPTRRPTRQPTRAPQASSSSTDEPTKTPSFQEDNTPSPNNPPPSPSPTVENTRAATGGTSAPTEEEQASEPSPSPVIQQPPPTPSPVIQTTESPTKSPEPTRIRTEQPTVAAISETTSEPSSRPTRKPVTLRPSKAPSTKRPSMRPTQRPTLAPAPAPAPSTQAASPFPASVPIAFLATLQAPTYQTPQQFADSCERIWETYITARLRAAYRDNSNAAPREVDLVVSVPGNKRQRKTRRLGISWMDVTVNETYESNPLMGDDGRAWYGSWLLRRRLQTQTFGLQALGAADFIVNASSGMTEQDFAQSAQQDMEAIITQESLQQALTLGGNDAVITSFTNSLNATNDSNASDTSRPNTRQITIGFLLLIMTLLSLVFWARVLYKKHQKERKQKRLAELRQSQSKLAKLPPPLTGNHKRGGVSVGPASAAAASFYPVHDPLPTSKEESSSSDTSSNYPGLDSLSDEGDKNDDDNDSDPFARELQEAVSIDQMAWTELLQQKEQLEVASRELMAPAPWTSASYADEAANVPLKMNVVGVYMAGTCSQDDGYEMDQGAPAIQRIDSFPYGDENDTSFLHHDDLELTLNDAVEWSARGVTLNVVPRSGDAVTEDDGNFEPYGDNQTTAASPSSRTPVQYTANKPKTARYSFAYPHQRQELSDSSQSSGDHDWMGQEDDDDVDVAAYQSRDFEDLLNELSSDDSDIDVDPGDMMNEVARLSDYVKRYGQKKEMEKSFRVENESNFEVGPHGPNPLLQRLETSRSSPRRSKPTGITRDFVVSSTRPDPPLVPKESSPMGFLGQAAAYWRGDRNVNLRTASLGSSASEEEGAGRLGIGRFTVQKPPDHLLSFRPSEPVIREGPPSVTPDVSEEDDDMERGPTPTSNTSSRPGPDTAVGKTPPRTVSKHLGRPQLGAATSAASKDAVAVPSNEPPAATATNSSFLIPVRNRESTQTTLAAEAPGLASRSTEPQRDAPKDNVHRLSTISAPLVKGVAAVPVVAARNYAASREAKGDEEDVLSDEDGPPEPPKAAKRGWKPPTQTSPRSKNSNLSHIISMFESKPKTAIKPLSENWQYNGASPRNKKPDNK